MAGTVMKSKRALRASIGAPSERRENEGISKKLPTRQFRKNHLLSIEMSQSMCDARTRKVIGPWARCRATSRRLNACLTSSPTGINALVTSVRPRSRQTKQPRRQQSYEWSLKLWFLMALFLSEKRMKRWLKMDSPKVSSQDFALRIVSKAQLRGQEEFHLIIELTITRGLSPKAVSDSESEPSIAHRPTIRHKLISKFTQ